MTWRAMCGGQYHERRSRVGDDDVRANVGPHGAAVGGAVGAQGVAAHVLGPCARGDTHRERETLPRV